MISKRFRTLAAMILSFTLVACSFVFLPDKAYAAAQSDISVGDFVDVGRIDAEGYKGAPHWRVLDKADDGSMLLMSEGLWTGDGTNPDAKIKFINVAGGTGSAKVINDQVLYWRGTDAEIWADKFCENILGNVEGLTVVPTTRKIDDAFWYETTLYGENNKELFFAGTDPMNSVLYQNKVYFLSAEEVVKYMKTPAERVAYLPGSTESTQWLLRSSQENTNWASEVKPDGEFTFVSANTGRAARPVFWAQFAENTSFVKTVDESGAVTWTIGKSSEDPQTDPGSQNDPDSQDKPTSQVTSEQKAKKVKTVTVNTATVSASAIDKAVKKAGGSKKYVTKIVLGSKVKKIKAKAFSKYSKVTSLEVKTKKLTKKSVKNSLKSSKVKTVKVKVAKKAATNKKFVKKYKKIFTKKNAGKKVAVKK